MATSEAVLLVGIWLGLALVVWAVCVGVWAVVDGLLDEGQE